MIALNLNMLLSQRRHYPSKRRFSGYYPRGEHRPHAVFDSQDANIAHSISAGRVAG
jgi:hypothetical protein